MTSTSNIWLFLTFATPHRFPPAIPLRKVCVSPIRNRDTPNILTQRVFHAHRGRQTRLKFRSSVRSDCGTVYRCILFYVKDKI